MLNGSASAGFEGGFVQQSIGNMELKISNSDTLLIALFQSARNDGATSGNLIYACGPAFQLLTVNGAKYQLSSDKTVVLMQVALYNDAIRLAAANYLSRQSGTFVRIENVLPLPLMECTLVERLTNCKALPLFFDSTATATVTFQLSKDQATNLCSLIDNEMAQFAFAYKFKKASTEISSYSVNYQDIRNNQYFQKLAGNGGSASITREGSVKLSENVYQSLNIIIYEEVADYERVNIRKDLEKTLKEEANYIKKIDCDAATLR
jgi:hypothetical protein